MPRNSKSAQDRTDTSTDDEVAELSFEQAVAELESIIERIERGEIGLEESLAQRKRGDALVKRCRTVLDAAEQELQQISQDEGKSTGQ